MRLGACEAVLKEGSLAYRLYQNKNVSERHRHRYEVNPKFHRVLTENGLVISGMSPNGVLAEFIEVPSHPYFIGTQAHPELKSRLMRKAPLFYGLIGAALDKKISGSKSELVQENVLVKESSKNSIE